MTYPKATCVADTEALRMANERAKRWERRYKDALAEIARLRKELDAK